MLFALGELQADFSPKEIASILRRADKELSGNTWHLGEYDYIDLGDSLLINPQGRHYVYTYNRQDDTFFRRDVSQYHGHNFGRQLLLYNGNVYSLGGYGFWKSHAKLLKFEWRTGEWEIIQYKNSYIPGKPISYFIRNDTLHVLGIFVQDQERGLNYTLNHYYRLDLKTMEVDEFKFNQTEDTPPFFYIAPVWNNQKSQYSIMGINGNADYILDSRKGELYINKTGPSLTKIHLALGRPQSDKNYAFVQGDSIYVVFENGMMDVWETKEYIQLYCKLFWSVQDVQKVLDDSPTKVNRAQALIGAGILFFLIVVIVYLFIRRERIILRKWSNFYKEIGETEHVFRNIQSLTTGLYTEKELDIALNIIHLPKEVRNIKRSRLVFIVNDDLPGFIQKEKNEKSQDEWLYRINNRH